MYSVNARLPDGEPDVTTPELTERIRRLCGSDANPRNLDDGSFTILFETEARAQQVQSLLSGAKFRMRDRRPWKVEQR